MASYQNAVVYAIRSHQTDLFYIGSTRTPMYKRLSNHRSNYKAWCKDNTHKYVSSYEILKYDDAYIELLEEYPCENSAQLCKKEGECIRLHRDVCVNVQIAGRSKKAYRDTHKEESNAYQTIYREAHKEELKAYDKAYRDAHLEEIHAKDRKRYHDKKEQINAKKKVHYEANKDQILAQQKAYREAKKAIATDP